jgi:hypothetical protein
MAVFALGGVLPTAASRETMEMRNKTAGEQEKMNRESNANTPQPISREEALRHFNSLPTEQQVKVMMARTRIGRCQACPTEWPLARKVGVADLCNGGITE